MARRIQDPEAAVAESSVEVPPAGVTFIKNQVNEMITLEDGRKYKFQSNRVQIEDPELIDLIRKAAAKPNNPHRIFEATK